MQYLVKMLNVKMRDHTLVPVKWMLWQHSVVTTFKIFFKNSFEQTGKLLTYKDKVPI